MKTSCILLTLTLGIYTTATTYQFLNLFCRLQIQLFIKFSHSNFAAVVIINTVLDVLVLNTALTTMHHHICVSLPLSHVSNFSLFLCVKILQSKPLHWYAYLCNMLSVHNSAKSPKILSAKFIHIRVYMMHTQRSWLISKQYEYDLYCTFGHIQWSSACTLYLQPSSIPGLATSRIIFLH